MKSLRLRLVLLLSLSLGFAWAAAAWFTHLEARKEVDKLFDAQLAQSAQVLIATTRRTLHERAEHNDDEIGTTHEYEQVQTFQIWDEDGLVLRSSSAPDKPLSALKAGYAETWIGGQPWRVFTRIDGHHKHAFVIQVAEPLDARERLARDIAVRMLLPSLVVLPILALLIWLAVGTGLRPLRQLRNELTQRAATRLDAVRLEGVPSEVAPLVQSLNELFEKLQLAFDSERRFTADAAHELRTPLAALKTQAQVALRSTDQGERRNALENVLRGTDRAARLIEQLLTLARVDPDQAATAHLPVDLRCLVRELIVELAPAAHAKQIELELAEGPEAGVAGNRDQLAVMLRNLLDNAIRYTPNGGEVIVRISPGTLEICDTGPGIPKAERERVLQRFYRIPGNVELGSGLGLSIVRRIAEIHQARLDLTEKPNGHGLAVRVHFG